jgi:hypothetical protein|tara:strand:- start:13991 stop:14800 length:810 start_codon:yes stop_codon:yes gene_type:complete
MPQHGTAQVDAGSGVLVGHGSPRKRHILHENFSKAPILNDSWVPTTVDPTIAEFAIIFRGNENFQLMGTNAADANSIPDAGGGISLTTAGADADQLAIVPQQDSNFSSWGTATFGGADEVCFEWLIELPSALTDYIVFGGLSDDAVIDATFVAAEDDDSILIVFDDGVNSGKWQLQYSIGGTDYTVDLGVAPVASTHYGFQIKIDADGYADIYVSQGLSEFTHRHKTKNPVVVTSSHIDFIPRVGIEAQAAAAKNLNVRYAAISKAYNN